MKMKAEQHKYIHDFLEQSARLYPKKLAVVHDKVRKSYEEVNAQANQLAAFLIESGVQRGDRVVQIFENCLEYVVGYYGTMKAGAVTVPLSNDLKADGLKYLLNEVEPVVILSSNRFEKLLFDSLEDLPGLKVILIKMPKQKWEATTFRTCAWEEVIKEEGNAANPGLHLDADDLASIIYTSGSTGRPKGVMLSHKNVVTNTFSICQYLHLTDKDIQMVVLPFFYVMGKSLLNTHFAVGGTVVINNKFAFPASVLEEMVREGVTGLSGVPSTYAYLLHRSPLVQYRDRLVSLRYCSQAGGNMPRIIKEGLRQVLPDHTEICIMYGATEASARLSYLEPERFRDKMDSIGKAIPGVSLRVLDPSGKEVPQGQVGELVAAGANIMKGYWRDPEATAKALVNGWYYTGDQAYQDAEGYFILAGRNDDLIKVSGHRINLREIEDVLMESGKFVEVSVVGIPDDLLGHRPVAVGVATTEGLDQGEILSYCAGKLAKFKCPSEIRLVRTLPKSPSGKVNRAKCLELLK